MLEQLLNRVGKISGIIHVGANVGQEIGIYTSKTNGPIVLIEPIDSVFETLKNNCRQFGNVIPVQAVCAEQDGRHVEFNVSSNAGESSSMLDLGRHGDLYPGVTYVNKVSMVTRRLDSLMQSLDIKLKPNILVMDTQATELLVLKGATGILSDIDAVYTEVSSSPLYEGGCTIDEITAFLREFGLLLIWTEMLEGQGWGDAYFLRSPRPDRTVHRLADLPTYNGNVALGKRAMTSSQMFPDADHQSGATNGKITGLFGFHTHNELNPWWILDLEQEYDLQEIRIYNRIDVASDRAATLEVLIGDQRGVWTLAHEQKGRQFGGADGNPLRVFLDGVRGRYVRLQSGAQGYLHLDEVEVYPASPFKA